MARIISRMDRLVAHQNSLHSTPAPEIDDATQARRHAAQVQLLARTQARLQAQEIVNEARASALAEHTEARQQGYLAGMQQARQEQSAITQALGALLANATVDHTESLRNLDKTVVLLVLDLVKVVLGHESTTAPETILHVARAALTELSVDATVVVRVHPNDVAILETHSASLGLPATVHITTAPDPSMTRGGCLIESGAGSVDARIEKQLERLKKLFDDHLLSS